MDRRIAELAVEAAYLVLSAKKLYYHGTSTVFAKKILSEGFDPNPKKKMWDPEQKRLASYEGTYFAQNFMNASSASSNAAMKFGGRKCIFEVQLETQSALLDEDDVRGFTQAIDRAAGFYLLDLLYNTQNSKYENERARGLERNREYLDSDSGRNVLEKATELWIDNFERDNLEEKMHPKLRRHIEGVARAVIEATLEAAAVGVRVDIQEDTPEIRTAMKELMRRLGSIAKFSDKFYGGRNARIVSPVGFGGANRILAAVVEPQNWDPRPKGFESRELGAPHPVYVVYGKPSSSMIAEMKKAWASNIKLIKTPLSRVPNVYSKQWYAPKKKMAASVL